MEPVLIHVPEPPPPIWRDHDGAYYERRRFAWPGLEVSAYVRQDRLLGPGADAVLLALARIALRGE